MFDIITDSACDLTLDTAKQLQIEVVPFYVSLDGEHYRKEGKEIAVRDFYQFMVDNPSAYPKTSLASIEDFEQAFRAHAAAGRDVLCLVFTSKMSGCVGSARNARDLVLEDFPDARIEVIDSAAATVTESTQNGLVTTGSDYAAYVASFNSKNTNPSVATGRTNPSYAGYNREAIK